MAHGRLAGAFGVTVLLAGGVPVAAQPVASGAVRADSGVAPPGAPRAVERVGMVAFGLVALVALDSPVRQGLQDGRTPTLDAVASGARQMGEWRVHIAMPLVVALAGAVAGDREVVLAGAELGAASLLVAGTVTGLKHAVGRSRPLCRCSPLTFAAAGPGRAFPSGHTAAAFATATVLARHTDRTWLRAGLYGAAALTGWSRMNDDKHWLSDVAAGAALGVLAGRAVTGRGHPRRAALPRLAVGPAGPAVGWLVEF